MLHLDCSPRSLPDALAAKRVPRSDFEREVYLTTASAEGRGLFMSHY